MDNELQKARDNLHLCFFLLKFLIRENICSLKEEGIMEKRQAGLHAVMGYKLTGDSEKLSVTQHSHLSQCLRCLVFTPFSVWVFSVYCV